MPSNSNTLDRTAGLTELWRRVRLQVVALAEGGTMNFDSVIGNGKPSSQAPPRAGSELDRLDAAWAAAETDDEREDVIRAVIDELDAAKVRKRDHRVDPGTEEWRRAIARHPGGSRAVGRVYKISHTLVCQYRREFPDESRTVHG